MRSQILEARRTGLSYTQTHRRQPENQKSSGREYRGYGAIIPRPWPLPNGNQARSALRPISKNALGLFDLIL